MMLFAPGDLPRRAPIKRMHVADAGHDPSGTKSIRFECRRCGHDTGYVDDIWTISENRRGHPCPVCNPSLSHAREADNA